LAAAQVRQTTQAGEWAADGDAGSGLCG